MAQVTQVLTIVCDTSEEWATLLLQRDECVTGLRSPPIENSQEYPSTKTLVLQLTPQPLVLS